MIFFNVLLIAPFKTIVMPIRTSSRINIPIVLFTVVYQCFKSRPVSPGWFLAHYRVTYSGLYNTICPTAMIAGKVSFFKPIA
jgi:hypothetical protein